MILINNSFTNFLDFAVKPMPHPTADKLVALFVRGASHQLPHQQIFEKKWPKFENFEVRNSRLKVIMYEPWFESSRFWIFHWRVGFEFNNLTFPTSSLQIKTSIFVVQQEE